MYVNWLRNKYANELAIASKKNTRQTLYRPVACLDECLFAPIFDEWTAKRFSRYLALIYQVSYVMVDFDLTASCSIENLCRMPQEEGDKKSVSA